MKHRNGEPPRIAGFAHIADEIEAALADFYAMLEREAADHVEPLGGFTEQVTPRQRPWSHALDRIHAERDGRQT